VKYVRVIEWSAEGDSIRLEMLGEDQETHRFRGKADPVFLKGGFLRHTNAQHTGFRFYIQRFF